MTTTTSSLRDTVAALAAEEVATAWPLERFVAVNPLAGLEHLSFGEAVEHAGRTVGAPGWRAEAALREAERAGRIEHWELRRALRRRLGDALDREVDLGPGRTATVEAVLLADLRHAPSAAPPARTTFTPAERWDAAHGTGLAVAADELMSGWLAAYLDAGAARWSMPRREEGLWSAWRALARHDRAFSRDARRAIGALPADGEAALAVLLDGVALDRDELLRALLTRQPGWTAHARWHAEHAGDLELVDLAAVRLACERALLRPPAGADPLAHVADTEPAHAGDDDGEARRRAVLDALDAEDAAGLEDALALLDPAARPAIWQEALEATYRAALLHAIGEPAAPRAGEPPLAQVVCCIDVRSEVLRRHLEATGPYETLGFAGFFGLPVNIHALDGEVATEQCPVLVSPVATVHEVPAPGAAEEVDRTLRRTGRRAAARDAIAGAKKGLAAKYVFAEAAGFVTGPAAVARTFAPGLAGPRLDEAVLPTRMDLSELALEDRVDAAAGALRAMGLVDGFASVVLLCGHGATTTNNPHQAALDCGACGGHRGGPNARAMAEMLNDPDVRVGLAARGIAIPDATWFAAGEHDTVTDEVRLLDPEVPASHRDAVTTLRADLARAGTAAAAERARRLPGDAAPALRGRDWAQLVPEWGLAGCAALIVGGRELTAGRDLGGRTFLHSYDADADVDGSALRLILTAPLVVAHWIASQYYFSAVAPEQYGAGTKISHNVVSGIGVLSGPGGDLRGGLPWESVAAGARLEHEPMRLLAVVDAARASIDEVLADAPQVARLVDGEWLTLVARDDAGSPWERRVPGGGWTVEASA